MTKANTMFGMHRSAHKMAKKVRELGLKGAIAWLESQGTKGEGT
jgi:hypothetical protein